MRKELFVCVIQYPRTRRFVLSWTHQRGLGLAHVYRKIEEGNIRISQTKYMIIYSM